ncbi:tyrosine-type recombinase/integrase [Actinomycetospora sp. TBRC 11914]|uniref:tyrosine-type recombinase/integrase n=1 Tax=Actinomycetospora sp. TBRC 11914 TaxID=2729387 RepID=UPI002897C17A|nr:tyrosine-type recombinase/integrase [Actinomycetospora sp. TBRC 11914]
MRKIGPAGFHPHELRHTAASLAIASGADVKVVRLMLGHKTATMTLDLYGHLSLTDSPSWPTASTTRCVDRMWTRTPPPTAGTPTSDHEHAAKLRTGPRSSGDRAPLS